MAKFEKINEKAQIVDKAKPSQNLFERHGKKLLIATLFLVLLVVVIVGVTVRVISCEDGFRSVCFLQNFSLRLQVLQKNSTSDLKVSDHIGPSRSKFLTYAVLIKSKLSKVLQTPVALISTSVQMVRHPARPLQLVTT